MVIEKYGWDETFDQSFMSHKANGFMPARVVMRNRDYYKVVSESGSFAAKLSGRYAYLSKSDGSVPVVGDWVAVQIKEGVSDAVIQAMVGRKSCLLRKQAGLRTDEQTLASNIDTFFIVNGLDGNFNINRIERYLTVAAGSGANPVVLLNKADLCGNPDEYAAMVRKTSPLVPVHCISVVSETGMEALAQYMQPGKTLAFLGSSGVGKSTIINRMFGEEMQTTQSTSAANGKGKHTTTCAELFLHESGCMLIDTPGIRELKPWCDEEAVDGSFEDVMLLAGRCRFKDCRHETEPGCAVHEAIINGQLSAKRYDNFVKLHLEASELGKRKKQKEQYLAHKIRNEKIRGSLKGD